MTNALRTWQLDHHSNQGLYLDFRKDAEMELHPHAVGLATNREEMPDKEVRLMYETAVPL